MSPTLPEDRDTRCRRRPGFLSAAGRVEIIGRVLQPVAPCRAEVTTRLGAEECPNPADPRSLGRAARDDTPAGNGHLLLSGDDVVKTRIAAFRERFIAATLVRPPACSARPMRSLSFMLAALLAAIASCATAPSAFGWGETQRVPVPALSAPPESFPAMSPEVASAMEAAPPGIPTPRAQLEAKKSQHPMAVAVDGEGATYVASLSSAVSVLDSDYLDLYEAALLTLRRVNADGTADELKTFITQSEGGFPGGYKEAEDVPVGMVIDTSADTLYLSVPGEGINALSLTSGRWSRFVADDRENWTGGEGGEGLPSGEALEEGTYGSLWENGPTAPGVLAVDPKSHHVFVADAGGGSPSTFLPDRAYWGALTVREFSANGTLVGEVPFDAGSRSGYPTLTGFDRLQSEVRPWLPTAGHVRRLLGANLGTGTISELDTRLARLVTKESTGATELVGLSQFEPISEETGQFEDAHTGQIVTAMRPPGGGWSASALHASDTRPFGRVRGGVPPGVEDMVLTKRGNYFVPSVVSPEFIEVEPDGDTLGVVRAAAGSSACQFDFNRLRMVATDDGTIVVLQQPAPGGTAELVWLDPRAQDAPANPRGCETDLPQEVERVPPTLEVVATEYSGAIDGDAVLAAPFERLGDGGTVELDPDGSTDGWVFSVRATDPDNDDQPVGPGARCVIKRTSGGVTVERTLDWSGCRAKVDGNPAAGVIQGATLAVTRAELANGPMDVQVEIVDDDDPAGVATFRATVLLPASNRPLEPRITANKVGRDQFRFVPSLPPNTAFDYWRLEFGADASPRRQPVGADGTSTSFPNNIESDLVTYGALGTHTATLVVGRSGGEEASATVEVEVLPEEVARPTTTLQPQSGAPCDTPLGIPLALVGLGDELLCVPADPCDVNTQELGLTRLPIVRPETCAGTDAGAFAASDVAAQVPLGSRPVFLARTLKLGLDRRIAARIRCGTGPTACSGSVRLQIPASGGRSAVSLGTARFSGLVSGKSATVKVKVSAAKARSIRRRSRSRVRVTVSPTVPAGFARPRADARTVNLTATKPRKQR